MRWIISCLVWSLVACAPTESENSAGAPAADATAGPGEWQTLFDGTDLDAFMMVGDVNWAIEDDAVSAQAGEGGHLVTNERFTDFELEVEFFVSPDANSGVFIRCDDPNDVAATTCYEVNIFDTRTDQTYRTGGLVEYAAPAVILYTGGRWNRYEIEVRGTNLRAVLNGEEMFDVEDATYAGGHITLQYGSGTVMFRNVRVRRL